MTRTLPSPLPHIAVAVLLAACGGASPSPTVDGTQVVPIDPSRPGDSLFNDGLTLYRQAEAEQASAFAARTAGDAAAATTQFTASTGDYALARGKFDQLAGDATLCPSPSIRCDNAAYLAGRSSFEIGVDRLDLASLAGGDPALLADAQAAFTDARGRLDAMLAAFPGSAFEDSAAYFAGRARFELVSRFGVGTYAEAEPLFERAYAANGSGTWADNALYYDGRCEFETGYPLVAAGTAALTQADYDQARQQLAAAIGAENTLLSRFALSSYRDNADYYLGRALIEKPTPDMAPQLFATAQPDTERVANLGSAITALGQVIALGTSPFDAGSRYWRGRAHYALWFHQTGTNAQLDLALTDFHSVPATSGWRDNALYYAVRSDLHEGNAAAACEDYANLLAGFPSSTYTARAASALSTAAVTCP